MTYPLVSSPLASNAMKPLQTRVLERREELGLSHEGLARATGTLSKQSIINIEKHGQVPSAKSLALLAIALRCSSDYLLGLTDRVAIVSPVSPASPAADEQTETETADRLLAAMQGRTEKAPRAQHPGSRKAG